MVVPNQDPKMATEAEVEAEEELEELDFSSLSRTTKAWHGPKVSLSNSSYQAEATAVVGQGLVRMNVEAGTGSSKPDLLKVSRYGKGSQDFVGVPTKEMSVDTILIKWAKKGLTAAFDLAYILQVQPVPIPPDKRAVIPIEFKTVKGRDAIVFRFSQMEMVEVIRRPRKKK
jgi:hypothetical protein